MAIQKHYLLVLLSISLLSISAFSSTVDSAFATIPGTVWEFRTNPHITNIYDTSFIDENEGWAVGRGGVILHTTDGGDEWVSQTTPTTKTLFGVFFLDEDNGWAVGDNSFEINSVILHTTNGGVDWEKQTSDTLNQLQSVQFLDESEGWIVGNRGTILHTVNGGDKWEKQTTPTNFYLYGISFLDENNGWAVGRTGIILTTDDGGDEWKKQRDPSANEALYGVSFLNATHGWAVGDVSSETGSNVQHTKNGGTTWKKQNIPTDSPLREVSFLDENNGLMVGFNGTILHTENGGTTWDDDLLYTDITIVGNLETVSFLNEDTAVTLSSSGEILKRIVNDIVSPDVPIITQPTSPTNGISLTVIGTAEAGSSLVLTLNTITQNPVTVDGDGNWSVEVTLIEGENTFTATVTDEADNSSDPSSPVYVTLDITPPAQPTINQSTTPTNDTSLTITGTGDTGSKVVLVRNGVTYDSVTINAVGEWSVDVTITEGGNLFTATATDGVGNESAQSNQVNVRLDTTPPVTPTIIHPTSPTNDTSLRVTGTSEVGSTVVLTHDNKTPYASVSTNQNGIWGVDVTLTEGRNVFSVIATDSSNNTSARSSSVTVTLDTVAPTITVPPDTVTLELGSTLPDLFNGVSVNDDSIITTTGSVDVDILGDYIITYHSVDSAGNQAAAVTRTYTVSDTIPPVIRVTPDTVTLELGSTLPDLFNGVSVNDDSIITTTGSVDVDILGDYIITYHSVDSAGNQAAAVTRTYTVSDTIPPVIRVTPDTVTLELGSTLPDLFNGVSVNDDSIITTTGSVDVDILGDHIITYHSVDSAGNQAAAVTRTYTVSDTIPPVIRVTPDTVTLELGSTLPDLFNGVSVDGDYEITTTGSVDVNVLGDHIITYHSVDSAGNQAATVTRTYTVSDTIPPVIRVTPDTVTLELGSTLPDLFNGVSVNDDSIITTTGSVDVNVLGDHIITYHSVDSAGNQAATVTRTYTVSDTIPPVIRVTPDTVTLELGSTLPDLFNGVSVNDDSIITTTGSVDVNVLGDHIITYHSVDSAGNQAATVTRTYTVSDTIPPVIRVTPDTVTLELGSTLPDLFNGVSVNDDSIITTTGSVDVNVLGDHIITYHSVDSAGNQAATVTRTYIIQDTTAPDTPAINQPTSPTNNISLRVTGTSEVGSTVVLTHDNKTPYASVSTNQNGIWGVDVTLTEGRNVFSVIATDSSNNTSARSSSVTVTLDTVAPTITVPPDTVTLELGSTLPDLFNGVSVDGDYEITTTGSVDVNVLGDHIITYHSVDSAGNQAATVTRTYTVSDTIPPVIRVTPDTVTLELGSTLPDLFNGVSVDGDYEITTTGSVDVNVLGDHIITYHSVDSAGNQAATVTRTYTVSDTIPPVIRVTPDTVTLELGSTLPDLFNGVSVNDDSIITTTGSVDVNVLGDHIITYHSVDSAGNQAATVTRTYTVSDTIPPVIRVTPDTVTLELGSTLPDLFNGVSVNDDSIITTTGSVDVNVLGDHIITYHSVDSAGNQAATVTRTYTVSDTIPPVIRVTPDTVTLELGSTLPDLFNGVSVDGDYEITTTGSVDVNVLGDHIITYHSVDSAGNQAATVTRTYIIQDTTAPDTPAINQPTSPTNNISLRVTGTSEVGSTVVLTHDNKTPYASVSTNQNGIWGVDVTLTEGRNVFSVIATDSSNNTSARSSSVTVTLDTVAPTITVPPDTVTLELGSTLPDLFNGVSVDGDYEITTTGSVDVNVLGDHIITYHSVDSAGNQAATVTRTYTVSDTIPPVIRVTPDTVTLELGSTLPDLFNGVSVDGDYEITTTGSVDVNVLGDHIITYHSVDSAGNQAATVTRTYTVSDTIPPVIRVTPDTVTLEVNSKSPDLLEGVLTNDGSPITVTGTGNINIPGTYILTYHSTDSAGNIADPVSRTYIIQDTTEFVQPTINQPTTPTNNISLRVTGTSEVGSTVVLTHNDESYPSVVTNGNGVWGVDVTLTEGENIFTAIATATNSESNSSDPSASVTVTLDTTAPAQPTILQPPTPTTDNSVTITGTGETGSSLVLTRNGVTYDPVTVDSDGNWSVDVILAEKQNTFIATATDSSGNESGNSSPVVIRLDTTPPPTPRITTSSDTVTSSPFTINGSSTGIGIVVTLFNGDTLVTTTTSNDVGEFSFTVPLNEGENTFTVTATDGVGNESAQSNQVTITLNPPNTLSVTITTTDTTVNTESFTISGTSTNADSVALFIDGSLSGATTVPDSDGNWSFDVTLNEGENILGAIVSSVGGFPIASTDDITVTLYIIPPPSVTLVTTDTSVNDKSFTIYGTSNNADVVTLNVNGANTGITTSPDSDGNWDFGVILNEGPNVLGATVSGVGGTASTNNITVILDVTAPIITVTPDTVTLELGSTLPDLLAGVSVGDDSEITTTGTVDINVPGSYTITYHSVDSAGNQAATVTRTYTVSDTIPPVITVTPDTVTLELGSTLPDLFNGVSVNDDSIITTTGSVDIDILGTYTITYNSIDDSDNQAAAVTRTYTVSDTPDTTAPAQPSIIQPTTPTNDISLTVTGTAEAGSSLVLTRNSTPQNSVTTNANGEWSVNVTLTEGANTFTAVATDASGNSSVSSVPVVVTLDTVSSPDSLSVTITTTDTTVNTELFTFSGTSTGAVKIELHRENEIIEDTVIPGSDGNWFFDVILTEGENVLTVIATDSKDENISSKTTITLNSPDPVDPTDSKKKSGGGSNDWKKKPTFGKSWEITTAQIVENGFTFNGHTLDITDNWHTDFNKTSSIIGEDNRVEIKVYTDKILKYVTLSLGVPEIGDVSNAETDIIVNLQRNYTSPSGYDITGTTHEQKESLVDEDSTISDISKVKCTDKSSDERCYMIGIDFTVNAPLKSDVLAISAVDTNRRSTITYINEGVEFVGESLLEADTHTMFVKNTSQDVGESLLLTQQDRRYNVYEDGNGYLWIVNDHGSWIQITKPDFERHVDSSNGVMTRTHSGFTDLVLAEQDKAILVFDGTTLLSITPESFAHDYPEYLDGSLDKILLEKLSVEEILALEKSLNRLIYDDNW